MGRWDLRGQAPHTTELLGDPCAHLAFERGASRLVGVWTRRWTRTLEGEGLVRAAKLRAGALRALVAPPIARTTNRITPLGAVVAGVSDALERAVLEEARDEEAFAYVAAWLRGARRAPDPDVGAACALVEAIMGEPDITTVARLAAHAGLGVRSVQRLFRDYVGASPKWTIRRARLQQAALAIERGETSLARLAAELGYADQAHLSRDFKAAVGKTPREFGRTV